MKVIITLTFVAITWIKLGKLSDYFILSYFVVTLLLLLIIMLIFMKTFVVLSS